MTDAKRADELFTIQEALQIADQMDNAMLTDHPKRDSDAEWLRTWGMTPEYEQTTSGPKLLGEHDLLDPEDRKMFDAIAAELERLREENEGMRRLVQVSQDEAARLRERLADIDSRTKADADDLAKMRDGTKLTRAGIVEALVYQQQEIDTKEMLLGRLREENRKWEKVVEMYSSGNCRADEAHDALVKETES